MVLGNLRTKPQTVAYDVGILGDGLQWLCGTDVYVAADNHRIESLRSDVHDALIERHLQREQILMKALTALPTEDRQRCENLSRRSIRRQTAALSSGVEKQTLVGSKPFVEGAALVISLIGGTEQPCGSSAGAKLLAHGVVGAEPFVLREFGYLMKAAHQVWRQRQ